jgi:hypothetical protein
MGEIGAAPGAGGRGGAATEIYIRVDLDGILFFTPLFISLMDDITRFVKKKKKKRTLH